MATILADPHPYFLNLLSICVDYFHSYPSSILRVSFLFSPCKKQYFLRQETDFGGSDKNYINNIFIGNKIGFHVDDRLQNWFKEVLNAERLFKKRLDAVNHLQALYIIQYASIKNYFDGAAFAHRNIAENNIFIQVKKLIDGNKVWLTFKSNNWETNQDPGFVDWKSRIFF